MRSPRNNDTPPAVYEKLIESIIYSALFTSFHDCEWKQRRVHLAQTPLSQVAPFAMQFGLDGARLQSSQGNQTTKAASGNRVSIGP